METETAGSDLGDVRLNRRLGAMLGALGERPGKSLPTAFQDWSNTKAAYRFFSNGNVSEDKILEGHFVASALRIQATDGPVLILQDTTEFNFKRVAPEKIGFTKVSTGRKLKEGRFQKHAICGLLMHASLAITPDGLPLGLTAAKFWSRSKFKGTAALKRKINPTRVPIEQKESMRWLDNLRLATAERLANCIALCCVVAWRVSWLTMLSRKAPATDPAAVFTEDERNLLDQAAPDRKRQAPRDLQFYVRAVARLGGYLDRASDAPPGTTVIWRGFSRLADLVEGARLTKPPADTCG
ncbi:IS4/Tn5 family transposase DNA-binding protein [Microbulbifer sp. S227A]|uniref:IS4/Tn5 family transposase DNA-binding protein n=1 Tax=Microbulbifer sp. S227A TaxID=3415131 RepID=UPI003C7C8F9D